MPKANYFHLLILGCVLLSIYLFTRFIVQVDITTENKELREIIEMHLEEEGIKKYFFAKDNMDLTKIKETILNRDKELLEWINIERKGMHYIVRLEPKVTKNAIEEKPYCHVTSTKEGTISRIITSKGVELVEINDYVRTGDILISGDIIYNEESKKQVCASGRVFLKTWYTIDIETTKTYEEQTPLDKFRYNLKLKYHNKTKKIFNERVENPYEKDKKVLSLFGYELYLTKEYASSYEVKEYDEESLSLRVNQSIDEKMSSILKGEYQILERKVLKKEENDSTINMVVFIVAEEEATEEYIPPAIEEVPTE